MLLISLILFCSYASLIFFVIRPKKSSVQAEMITKALIKIMTFAASAIILISMHNANVTKDIVLLFSGLINSS